MEVDSTHSLIQMILFTHLKEKKLDSIKKDKRLLNLSLQHNSSWVKSDSSDRISEDAGFDSRLSDFFLKKLNFSISN